MFLNVFLEGHCSVTSVSNNQQALHTVTKILEKFPHSKVIRGLPRSFLLYPAFNDAISPSWACSFSAASRNNININDRRLFPALTYTTKTIEMYRAHHSSPVPPKYETNINHNYKCRNVTYTATVRTAGCF